MGAYLSEPITKKISSDECGKNVAFGASSMQGWRVSQEDAHNCCIDFDDDTSLFAVYDGHGGHEVATYCAKELPDFIKNTDSYKRGDIKQSLIDAFLGFDAALAKPDTVCILKEIAGTANGKDKNRREKLDACGSGDDDDEESVSDLRMEAAMPLEQVMARYSLCQRTNDNKKSALRWPMGPSCSSSSCWWSAEGDEGVSSSSGQIALLKNKDDEKKEKKDENDDDERKNDKNAIVLEPEKISSDITKVETSSNGISKPDSSADTRKISGDKKNEEICKNIVEKVSSSIVENFENGDSKFNNDEIVSTDTNDNSQKICKVTARQKRKITRISAAKHRNIDDGDDEDDDDDDEDDDDENDETFDGSPIASDDDTEDVGEENEEHGDSSEIDEDENEKNDEEEDDDDDDDEEEEDEEEEEDDEDDGDFTMDMTEEPGSDSGCTAVVAILHRNDLYVANAGDSRCVICRDGQALELSLDHKPEDEPEMERIVKAGGKVTADGRVNGGLNLSRALGDHAYKQNTTLTASEQMISAMPDVRHITVEPERDEFMILACDGIWNFMSSQEVVSFVRPRLINNELSNISKICEELFDHCLATDTLGDGTGCDNMTAVIVRFNRKNLTSIVCSKKRPISPASLDSSTVTSDDLSEKNNKIISDSKSSSDEERNKRPKTKID